MTADYAKGDRVWFRNEQNAWVLGRVTHPPTVVRRAFLPEGSLAVGVVGDDGVHAGMIHIVSGRVRAVDNPPSPQELDEVFASTRERAAEIADLASEAAAHILANERGKPADVYLARELAQFIAAQIRKMEERGYPRP